MPDAPPPPPMHPTVHDDDRGAFVVCGRGERRAAQHCEAAAHLGRRRVWAHRCWNAGFECVSAWRQAGWLAGWRRHARASRLGLGGRAAAGAGWGGAGGRAGGAWGCERAGARHAASGCVTGGHRGALLHNSSPRPPGHRLQALPSPGRRGRGRRAARAYREGGGGGGGARRRVGDLPTSTGRSSQTPAPRPHAHHAQQVWQVKTPSLQQPHGQTASRRRPSPPPAWTKRGGGGRSGAHPSTTWPRAPGSLGCGLRQGHQGGRGLAQGGRLRCRAAGWGPVS